MNSTIETYDDRLFIAVGDVIRSPRRDGRCPACRGEAHGSADVTCAVAYGKVHDRTLHYVGETESDDVWNNQMTLILDGLPVLECGRCYTWYTTRFVTETA